MTNLRCTVQLTKNPNETWTGVLVIKVWRLRIAILSYFTVPTILCNLISDEQDLMSDDYM